MVPVKKAFVLALATFALTVQAHAGTEARPDADPAKLDQSAKDAGDKAASNSRTQVAQTVRQVRASSLTRLSPTQSHNLIELMLKDASIHDEVREILKLSGSADQQSLLKAQLEGLSNLKGIDQTQTVQAIAAMDPEARAAQAYATLVTKTARAARDWKGQPRDVSLSLLIKANAYIASGRTPAEGLKLAKEDVQKDVNANLPAGSKPWTLDLDDIFKQCKNL